jgi:hypothetical protein
MNHGTTSIIIILHLETQLAVTNCIITSMTKTQDCVGTGMIMNVHQWCNACIYINMYIDTHTHSTHMCMQVYIIISLYTIFMMYSTYSMT